MTEDYGATVRDWVDLVRRARLGRTTKAVAFAIAQYADGNGRRIFPGLARLSIECELSYNATQNSMRHLRDVGLIELVRSASGRGRADEYRLIIGPQLGEAVDVLAPNEVVALAEKLRTLRRGKYRRPTPPDLRPTGMGAEVDDDGDLRTTAMGAEPVDNSVDGPDLRTTPIGADSYIGRVPAPNGAYAEMGPAPIGTWHLHPTARPPNSHDLYTRATNHKTAEVVDDLTVPCARPVDQHRDSDSEVKPDSGRHAAPDESEPEPTNVIPIRRTA